MIANYKKTLTEIFDGLALIHNSFKKFHFTRNTFFDFLKGNESKAILTFNLKENPSFGILGSEEDDVINKVVKWFINNGFLSEGRADSYIVYDLRLLPNRDDFIKYLNAAYYKPGIPKDVVKISLYDLPVFLYDISPKARSFLVNHDPNTYHSVMAFFEKQFFDTNVDKVLNSYIKCHSDRKYLQSKKNLPLVREIVDLCIRNFLLKITRRNRIIDKNAAKMD